MGQRQIEGEAVPDANAEHVDVGVGNPAGADPGAAKEAATDGDAAHADAAARVDANEPGQRAQHEAIEAAVHQALRSGSVHDDHPLSM